ncbi:C40 family peptidase [Mariniflexile sp.]|uniref:C40 family peptidase n=1 Tax=Mariniflexile sp. TaxID=1979402 RepID=UPI0040472DF7
MKKIITILLLTAFCLTSCKSSKKIVVKKGNASKTIISKRTTDSENFDTNPNDLNLDAEPIRKISGNSKADDIIDYAKQFSGVKYKFGGATREGMDCSGLVFESFRAFDVILPRISRDMAKRGDKISLKETQTGDLLFFKTRNRRNDINHVGLVVDIEDNAILFIHATTSQGVIISSLNESYWKDAFEEVRKVL